MRLTITDVRAAGHCVRGARTWFAEHGLDFRDFLAHGIDSTALAHLDDAIINQVISRKLQREAADDGS